MRANRTELCCTAQRGGSERCRSGCQATGAVFACGASPRATAWWAKTVFIKLNSVRHQKTNWLEVNGQSVRKTRAKLWTGLKNWCRAADHESETILFYHFILSHFISISGPLYALCSLTGAVKLKTWKLNEQGTVVTAGRKVLKKKKHGKQTAVKVEITGTWEEEAPTLTLFIHQFSCVVNIREHVAAVTCRHLVVQSKSVRIKGGSTD